LTRVAVAAIILAFAGCTSWSVSERPPGTLLLVEADRLVDQGEYARAVEAYDELLVRYPDAAAASRVRSSRDAVARLVFARAEVERLRGELESARRELQTAREQLESARRDGESARRDLETGRQALVVRDGDLQRALQELQRVTAESERLRADLERLKLIDLETERRRR